MSTSMCPYEFHVHKPAHFSYFSSGRLYVCCPIIKVLRLFPGRNSCSHKNRWMSQWFGKWYSNQMEYTCRRFSHRWLWRVLASMIYVVRWNSTDVSKEYSASVFSRLLPDFFLFDLLLNPEDGGDVTSKPRLAFNGLQGVISQKTELFLKYNFYELMDKRMDSHDL
jgi:hypothetical protein